MKHSFAFTLYCTLSLAVCPFTGSFAGLPEEIVVGTEPMPASEFKAWLPKDAAEYTGSYSGDIGGDTAGQFEIKVVQDSDKKGAYVATGKLVRKVAGQKPEKLDFKKSALNTSDKIVSFKIGKLSVSFVTYGKQHGIIIDDEFAAFIPKDTGAGEPAAKE